VEFTTADLCDAHPELVRVVQPLFREYGGLTKFSGPVETLEVFEDNALVREVLESSGSGRVLVVDGAGSLRCALVGDRLASLAHQTGWAGLLINGSVRDSAELREIPLGIRALSTSPRPSGKVGTGKRGRSITFAGVTFDPGMFLYADADGVLLAEQDLVQQVP
jgi:regulator of ribonuclease activity A